MRKRPIFVGAVIPGLGRNEVKAESPESITLIRD